MTMSFFSRLFGRSGGSGGGGASASHSASPSLGVRVFTSDEVNRVADKAGEMYYDCPKCGTCARINNIGKMMLESNPNAFANHPCQSCGHRFDAGRRLKHGKCPGFDYSTL